jgi:alpha-mannosidase
VKRLAPLCLCLLAVAVASGVRAAGAEASGYTRLVPAGARIIAAAPAFPGGGYNAENMLKPAAPSGYRAEYASHGLGAQTFVDFDLGAPVRVAAFRHMQRRTPDTIAEANLVFSDAADFSHVLTTVKVKHVDEPGATTFAAFVPVNARYLRWQVTSVLPGRSPNVGGQSIEFFAAGETEAKPAGIGIEARTVPILEGPAGALVQPLKVTLDYPYAEPAQVVVAVEGQAPRPLELAYGSHTLPYTVAAADAERALPIAITLGGEQVVSRAVALKPARKLTVYILPHSHTDIGYTAIQTDIEEKQINNLLQGLAAARRTADYPEGARFVWNVEVLWAADLFLQRLPPKHREEFLDAVKRGQVALNGMYLNELTGLCRPEELVRLFRYATQLSERTGVPVDSAMISDVPGYTWGTVTAMNQAGIKYFSVAPNYIDRIGDILVQWENKPFWWIGPDGKSRVLVWIPFRGYAMSHIYGKLSAQFVAEYCEGLEHRGYPYDIAYMRWAGQGDNAVPDPSICEFVKEWNATHDSPRFIISSTSEAFRAFEKRHGDQLPQVRGDWTPYWEDGAGSSAAETAMNRASSERLAQAETLWAMLAPKLYPARKFEEAWNNVLLYSEHTWGAHCSISQPAIPFTSDQWNIKQSYATVANLQSRQALSEAAQSGAGFQPAKPAATTGPVEKFSPVDIYNTTSWPRTAVVLLPHEVSELGNFVTDDQGRPVPAQRLVSSELAVLVRDLPPLAGRRYTIATQGTAPAETQATALAGGIANDRAPEIRLLDPSGAVATLLDSTSVPRCAGALEADPYEATAEGAAACCACTDGSPGWIPAWWP